jgi:signal transduction histidine kinase
MIPTSPFDGRPDMLVVDDDLRCRKLLEEYLLSAGYQVRSAPDGRTAIALAFEKVPDIVFLDVMMPDRTGLDVCRELKSHPRTRLCQVMMVTALSGTPHQVEGLDNGADDFVSKPVRREEFLAKVRSLLRARRLLVELERARESLERHAQKLEQLESLKETLTETLVHDLKNPLAAVLGNLELLERKGDERTRELVRRCKTGASRLHRMILDLLDVARLEEGALPIRPEPVDAVELARRALDEFEAPAAQRGVRLVLQSPEGVSRVHGDPSMLRRVLDNLLANALEHSPAGTEVTVRVAVRDEGVELSVADQGAGIPEGYREKIFEKYARLELRQAGVVGNRGLGLTFCRMAIEAHGGTIWVEPAAGGGAWFRALLPASDSVQEARAGVLTA